jgi:hypothetical protein
MPADRSSKSFKEYPMAKLGLFASILTILGTLAIASAGDDKPTPCKHTDFKTVLVKEACAKGGQPAAKDAMKKFMKDAKIKTCNACHTKTSPTYDLKDDAVDQFKKAGGKLLSDK